MWKNQAPLLDNVGKADVMWVGLSAKLVKPANENRPLGQDTNSGKLVHQIEQMCPEHSFYRTNLVKCAPLSQSGKLRYPGRQEMDACVNNLKLELGLVRPKIVFLLGGQVASFLLGAKSSKLPADYSFTKRDFDGHIVVPVHHPSFILIYRRKQLHDYVASVVQLITGERAS